MKLDIIVPRYKEPWELCRYLFDTISTQRGVPRVNYRVIVVNDGDEDVLDESVFSGYPYEIEYLVKPHGGVSDTRNYGLRYSDADYVMFCDADDGFLNNYALHLIFGAMQEGFDFLCSKFIEETYTENGTITIVSHDKDMTFMHGKVYRREWLLENEIVFDPAMTVHEDGYFNSMAYTTALHDGKVKFIETPIYLWRWNDNSVVRRDKKDFVLKTYEEVIRTRIGTCEQFKKRGYEQDYRTAVMMTFLNSYYDFQKTSYHTKENREYLVKAEQAFKKYFVKYKKVFYDCTNQDIAEVAHFARENAYKNGLLMEMQDLKSWLKHIDREVLL